MAVQATQDVAFSNIEDWGVPRWVANRKRRLESNYVNRLCKEVGRHVLRFELLLNFLLRFHWVEIDPKPLDRDRWRHLQVRVNV